MGLSAAESRVLVSPLDGRSSEMADGIVARPGYSRRVPHHVIRRDSAEIAGKSHDFDAVARRGDACIGCVVMSRHCYVDANSSEQLCRLHCATLRQARAAMTIALDFAVLGGLQMRPPCASRMRRAFGRLRPLPPRHSSNVASSDGCNRRSAVDPARFADRNRATRAGPRPRAPDTCTVRWSLVTSSRRSA